MSLSLTFNQLKEENERLRINAKIWRAVALKLAQEYLKSNNHIGIVITEEDCRRLINLYFQEELKKEQ